MALGIYWMLIRKKKRETAEWVPAALVRAYLDRVHADERDTRLRLFGDDHSYAPSAQTGMPLTQMLSGAAPVTQMVVTQDPTLIKEVEALRGQLATSDSRAMEFDRAMNGLRAEKTMLEQKVNDALAAAPAAGGAPNPAAMKELEELREKLREYEVIEDDLANLKKFQKENEQLKQRLSQLESGAPTLTVLAGGAATTEASTTVSNVTQKIETPVTVIAAARPVVALVAAPVAAPVPAPTAAPASGESNTNVLAPVTPTEDFSAPASAPAAADKSSKQKEEDLLSEFEKMLAS